MGHLEAYATISVYGALGHQLISLADFHSIN